MKKRQRKKNAKKSINHIRAALAVTQAQAILSQLYINRRVYTQGGIVPPAASGEIVRVNVSNETLLNEDQVIILKQIKEIK